MKIIINEKEKNFVFEMDGYDQTVTFQEVTESFYWKERGTINIRHSQKNEHGFYNNTSLIRGQFLEMMKFGREHYYRSKGVWDYNTGVHKLYAVLDGKTLAEAEQEVENLSTQHENLWKAQLDWNNERVVRYAEKEKELEELKAVMYPDKKILERIDLKRRDLKRVESEEPPYELPKEMQKMYADALDESKVEITLSNCVPEVLKGDKTAIQDK